MIEAHYAPLISLFLMLSRRCGSLPASPSNSP